MRRGVGSTESRPPNLRSEISNLKSSSSAPGLTLLEILVAVAIFSVGVIAIVTLFPAAIHFTRLASERMEASQLAISRLGQARTTARGDVLLRDDYWRTGFWTGGGLSQIQGALSQYEGYRTVGDGMLGVRDTYLQRVTFDVELSDGRHTTYMTYVSKQ